MFWLVIKGTVMQIEKALINGHLHVSKVRVVSRATYFLKMDGSPKSEAPRKRIKIFKITK